MVEGGPDCHSFAHPHQDEHGEHPDGAVPQSKKCCNRLNTGHDYSGYEQKRFRVQGSMEIEVRVWVDTRYGVLFFLGAEHRPIQQKRFARR